MKKLIAMALTGALAACVAMPSVAPAGQFASDADFTVTLAEDWSYWPAAQNTATTDGYLTQDGFILNRVHLISLKDGESIIKYAPKDAPRPYYSKGASETEIVDLVTASLLNIGYNTMEATDIRPATVDGQDGMRFGLTGKWDNGANVSGDVMAVVDGEDKLHLVMFLAPSLHYYGALEARVDQMMQTVDLSGAAATS